VTQFKKIVNTNFSIDIVGNILNNRTNKIKRSTINKNGYYTASVRIRGIRRNLLVHREVAKLFCENKDNLPIVNHIDGNKLNNHSSNLEWCTVQENTTHAYKLGLNSLAINVSVTDLKTNITKKYTSVQQLGNVLGIDDRLLMGRIKRSKKYPINDRYVISIKDRSALFDNLNSLNFGRVLYVYDYLTNENTKFDSLGQLMYETGIRNPLETSVSKLLKIGFIVDSKPIKNVDVSVVNKKSVIMERDKYYSVPYKKRNTTYCVIDLLSEDLTEHVFYTINDVKVFMSNAAKQDLSYINIGSYKVYPGSGSKLIRGFNIKILDNGVSKGEYAKFTYEYAYNNRYRHVYVKPLYEIIIDNKKHIISSTRNAINFLVSFINKDDPIWKININKITDETIQNSINDNNIKISRLNKIMI